VTLSAHQGLDSGFLAAGLASGQVPGRTDVPVFVLVCAVAGAHGAATVNRRILLVQALPSAVALAAVALS
jgi:putative membrane protein